MLMYWMANKIDLERKVFSLKVQLEAMSEQVKRDKEMRINLAKRLHKAETELFALVSGGDE